MKTCKIPSYTRKMKELIGKVTETSTAIVERRQAATLNLQDLSAVVRNPSFYISALEILLLTCLLTYCSVEQRSCVISHCTEIFLLNLFTFWLLVSYI